MQIFDENLQMTVHRKNLTSDGNGTGETSLFNNAQFA